MMPKKSSYEYFWKQIKSLILLREHYFVCVFQNDIDPTQRRAVNMLLDNLTMSLVGIRQGLMKTKS